MSDRRTSILSEAERLEQVTWFAAESHITAAGFWSTFQIFWGSAAAVLAAVAAGTAFAEHSIIAGALGIAATASAAVMASLQPSERLAAHLSYAGQYHALQSGLHSLRVLEADELSDAELLDKYRALAEVERGLGRTSPHVPRRLTRRAAAFIRERQPYYALYGLEVPKDLPAARRQFLSRLFGRGGTRSGSHAGR